jgi:hypothetical protein
MVDGLHENREDALGRFQGVGYVSRRFDLCEQGRRPGTVGGTIERGSASP